MGYHELWDHKFEINPGKWVFVPSEYAKARGLALTEYIFTKWQIPNYFYHLSKSHVEALRYHLNHKYFACIDISKFFGTINRSRVTRALKRFLNYETARRYAKDSVVIDPGTIRYMLPFGFTQSPLLASLCLEESKVGSFLEEMDSSRDLKVSVYVDDIVISSNDIDKLETAFGDLKNAVSNSGWTISPDKTQSPNISITAFNIKVSQGNMAVIDARMEEFINNYRNATSTYVKDGIVNYVKSVNHLQADMLFDL